MDEDNFDDDYSFDNQDDNNEQNNDFATYEDPNFDPDMPPDDDNDDDDEEENGYEFLEDPDMIDSLSVAEVKEYVQSIDPDELNESQQDGYEYLMSRSAQIEKDEQMLSIAQKAIDKYKKKVEKEKVKSPEAKKRLPQLYIYLAGLKALNVPLKPIVEDEIKAQGKASIKKVRNYILKEIAIAQAQLVAELAKDLFKLIPPPFNFIVLGVILALLLIFILILIITISASAAAAAPYANANVQGGILDTSNGIRGDAFYGVRLIYEDDEKAKTQLVISYENLVVDLITKIDEINGIDTTLELHYSGERPEQLTNLIKVIADQTDGSDEAFGTLEQHLDLIDHFGYTNVELRDIKTNLLAYITTNLDDIFTIDTSTYTANFSDDFDNLFDINYSSLNVTAPLYFVQDIIIEGDEEMVKGIKQKNYVAMIYLPKTNVVIDETNFMFYMHKKGEIKNAPTNVNIKFKQHTPDGDSILFENTADASWWDDDYSTTQTDIVTNITMTPADYYDETISNKKDGISIYSLLVGSGLRFDDTIIETLFSKQEIKDADGETTAYYVVDYLPDSNCYYMQFQADGIFQFCEFYTEYHLAS